LRGSIVEFWQRDKQTLKWKAATAFSQHASMDYCMMGQQLHKLNKKGKTTFPDFSLFLGGKCKDKRWYSQSAGDEKVS